ncbi:MAG: hypothetical protein AAFR27_15365, partial [Pseudomonadota bacterium]
MLNRTYAIDYEHCAAQRRDDQFKREHSALPKKPIYLASDNWSGAHPKIVEAMTVANNGAWAPYGGSERDTALDAKFSEVFETETSVFLCTTG